MTGSRNLDTSSSTDFGARPYSPFAAAAAAAPAPGATGSWAGAGDAVDAGADAGDAAAAPGTAAAPAASTKTRKSDIFESVWLRSVRPTAKSSSAVCIPPQILVPRCASQMFRYNIDLIS